MLQTIKKNKNKIVKIVIIIGIVLCVFGIMDIILENTILNIIHECLIVFIILKLKIYFLNNNYFLQFP